MNPTVVSCWAEAQWQKQASITHHSHGASIKESENNSSTLDSRRHQPVLAILWAAVGSKPQTCLHWCGFDTLLQPRALEWMCSSQVLIICLHEWVIHRHSRWAACCSLAQTRGRVSSFLHEQESELLPRKIESFRTKHPWKLEQQLPHRAVTLRGCWDSAGTDQSLPGPFGQASSPEGHNPLGCLCTSKNSCPLIYDSVFPLPLHVSLLSQKCPATCLVPTSWTSRSAHCHLLDPSSSLPPPLPPKRVQKKSELFLPVCMFLLALGPWLHSALLISRCHFSWVSATVTAVLWSSTSLGQRRR